MKKQFVEKGKKDLIVFLSGWGCDDAQFKNMTETINDYDLVLCWDYSDGNFELDTDFSKYEKVYLIAYSAGVFVANLVAEKIPSIYKKIAINGNPLLFDSYYGLTPAIEKVFREISLDNYMDFRRNYLVCSEEELNFFNAHSSMRTIESCTQELDTLKALANKEFKPCSFDKVLLGEKDRIFSYKKQCEYFKDNIVTLPNCAHNVFYEIQHFEDIISLAK